MTCDDFERVLPELVGECTVEQEAHLRSCSTCADLLADLSVISGQARLLQTLEEPSPRVWEFLQNALRSEGLIRERAVPVPRTDTHHALDDEDHVYFCPGCSGVREDLNEISEQARLLQASDEPSPRIWNSIEIALRNEGVVRELGPSVKPARLIPPRWRLAWVVPAAALAMLILATALFQRGGAPQQVAVGSPVAPALSQVADSSLQAEERELVRAVGERAPALKAGYEADLKVVDAYISDAEQSAKANPQDEVAQQYLRSAYDQRAMIYEMAMNRSIR
jgi:hypothetical protein